MKILIFVFKLIVISISSSSCLLLSCIPELFITLQMLPKVAAEVAAPLSKAKKITMISDSTSELGASKLTQEVLDIMNKIPETVTKITGVDISQQMNAGGRNGRR